MSEGVRIKKVRGEDERENHEVGERREAREAADVVSGADLRERPVFELPLLEAIPSLMFHEMPKLRVVVEAKVDVPRDVAEDFAVPTLSPTQVPHLSIECESRVEVSGAELVTLTFERPPQIPLRVNSSVERPDSPQPPTPTPPVSSRHA
ncbi:hypothetical protein [Infirmifilum sp.]|uniref:hypothetical protein n=1 Tax=Infirmifilum sp. TaxID=2856575 RepID=UPI003D0ADF71